MSQKLKLAHQSHYTFGSAKGDSIHFRYNKVVYSIALPTTVSIHVGLKHIVNSIASVDCSFIKLHICLGLQAHDE